MISRAPKTLTPKPTAQFKRNMASLDKYSSTNALAQTLMNTLKQHYENRDIRNITTAESARDSLEASDFDEFEEIHEYSEIRTD